MADRINLPSGMGGLVRYDEEYQSRFMLSPVQVVIFLILLIILVLGLRAFWA